MVHSLDFLNLHPKLKPPHGEASSLHATKINQQHLAQQLETGMLPLHVKGKSRPELNTALHIYRKKVVTPPI